MFQNPQFEHLQASSSSESNSQGGNGSSIVVVVRVLALALALAFALSLACSFSFSSAPASVPAPASSATWGAVLALAVGAFVGSLLRLVPTLPVPVLSGLGLLAILLFVFVAICGRDLTAAR